MKKILLLFIILFFGCNDNTPKPIEVIKYIEVQPEYYILTDVDVDGDGAWDMFLNPGNYVTLDSAYDTWQRYVKTNALNLENNTESYVFYARLIKVLDQDTSVIHSYKYIIKNPYY